ncbi:MAG: type II secretion system minor pseudopilin GspJ [Hyphomonas sp.]
MNAHRSGEAGITLVETLIALFLIALMATSGAVMLTQTMRGARQVDDRSQDARALEIALAMIREDLAAFADRPSRTDGSQDPPTRFEGYPVRFDGRILLLVRNGWSNPEGRAQRGDLQRVEYLYQDGALIRRSWHAPDAGPGTPVSQQRLIEGLDGVAVRYGRQNVWQNDWIVAATDNNAQLPDRVEFTMRFSPDDALTARFRLGLRE